MSSWRRTCALAAVLVSAAAAGRSQEFRATVTGSVTDPSGAALPGVRVRLTRLDTNTEVATLTNERGVYSVPFLPAGRYRATATHPRFRTCVRDGLVLRGAERVIVDLHLDAGLARETVQVEATVASTDRSQSILSQTTDAHRLRELPLNGRQVYMLVPLTSGAQNNQTTFRDAGAAGTRAWDLNGNYSIHGSRPENNEFLLDGSPHATTGGWQYSPCVDAVEEIKVLSASVDASLGRTSGGVVQLILRSGHNTFHGTAFLFHRGDALDANTTQNNRRGLGKAGHRFDNYGLVVSGPVRRDRTFFMASFDGFADRVPSPRTVVVPTERERRGDFSQTLDASGRPVTLYDPLTTRPDPVRPGRFLRDPFPGNRIPPERMSPAAQRLLAHLPLPNVPEASSASGNYVSSPNTARLRYDSFLVRLDHHFDARHRTFVTSTANWGAERRSENGFSGPARRGNWPRGRNHDLQTIDHVWTAGARTVFNLRASLDRFHSFNSYEYAALTEDLGIETPFQVVAQYPQITFDGYEGAFPNAPRRTVNTIASTQATMGLSRARHSLRLGADARWYAIERTGGGDGQGRFHFTRDFTQRDPLAGDPSSGNAFASFLLGYPASGGVDVAAASERLYRYAALFVQDEWRVTSRLTASAGLRWDYQAPVVERLDRLNVGFDTTTPGPFQVPALPLKGGLLFPTAQRRSPYRAEYTDLQPRLGVSYKLSGALALRANAGRSYLPLTGGGQEGFQQIGFSRRTSLVSSIETGVPYRTLDRPFPDGILAPPGASLGLATDIGSSLSFVNPDFRIPFADQWAVGLTFDLGRITLDAAYVGARSRRLPVARAVNEVPLDDRLRAVESLGGTPAYLLAPVANPFAGLVPGTALDAATVSRGQLLRPFPQFLGITMEKENAGSASYDALEVAVRTPARASLAAGATYTWARSFEALAYRNNGYDPRPERALAAFDRTHRLTVTAIWAPSLGGGRLLGGWQVSVIGEIQSGTPTVMPGGARRLASDLRPPDGERGLDRWFDNSTAGNPRPDGGHAWEPLAPFELSAPGARMPGIRDPWAPQWTLGLSKTTPLGNRFRVQWRLEAFNAFNTPIYAGPETDIRSSRFGRITPDQINFPRHVQLGLKVSY